MATVFRYEFRSGRFLRGLPLSVFMWFHWDAFYFIWFYYTSFCCVFQQKSCPQKLLYNSACPAYKFLFSINAVHFFWYQFYIILPLSVKCLCFSDLMFVDLQWIFQTDVLLLWAFAIGNALSNSDLISIRHSFVRAWSYSFCFGMSLWFVFLITSHIDFEECLLLSISIFGWYAFTRLQKKMNFPLLFLKT